MLRLRTAADPEQAVEVDADGGSGFGMESVGDVDPGADAACVRESGNERERERGASGAFGSGEFGDGADEKAAAERVIEHGNAGGRGGANDARGWSERGRNAVGEGSFDLLAEGGGGRHTELSSPYIRLLARLEQGEISTAAQSRSAENRSAKRRLAMKRLAEMPVRRGRIILLNYLAEHEPTLDIGSTHLWAICARAGCLGGPNLDMAETEAGMDDPACAGSFWRERIFGRMDLLFLRFQTVFQSAAVEGP